MSTANEMEILKEYYEQQWSEMPVGGQYLDVNRQFGAGINHYFKERFERNTKFMPMNLHQLRVLDLGSGSGVYSSFMIERKASVVAMDISLKSLLSMRLLLGSKSQKAELLNGNARELPFKDKSFDIIFLFDVIEHVPNYELVLKEVRRVLTEDGIILISIPSKWSYKETTDRLRFHLGASFWKVWGRINPESEVKKPFLEHVNWFTSRSMRGILQSNGFMVVNESYGCYLFPLMTPLLGRVRLIDDIWKKCSECLSKTFLNFLAWNVVFLAKKE